MKLTSPCTLASVLRRLGLALALLAGVLLMPLGAVAETSPQPSESPSPGVTSYRVGVLEYVDNLNPFLGYSVVSNVIYHLNYDYLTGYEPETLQPRGEFAESWTHSADGKTWTFKIRQGMTWQDAEPATARDVAFTFNYIIENQLASYTFYTTSIEEVTALDDATVRFVCSQPKADILYMPVPILPEHIWSKLSPEEAAASFPNEPPCIGSGPFQVVENKANSFARLVANKSYWRGAPQVDELLFITYKNADTMVQDLKAGNLDGVVGVPPAQFEGLSSPSITTNGGTLWGFTQLSFNCYDSPDSLGNPVLLDQGFRQALQYAVDREVITQVAFGGYATAGTTLIPPYSEYHWQPAEGEDYTFDPDEASALLDAAGYEDVNGDSWRETKQGKALTLRLYTSNERPVDTTIAKLVTGWFGDVGVKVRLEVLEPGTLIERVWNYQGATFTPDFDMMNYYWVFSYDPQTILGLLTADQIGAWSDTSWTDPAYAKLFGEQSIDLDLESRIAKVQEMQQIVHEASPYLIFAYDQQLEAYNTAEWTGYVAAPSGYPGYSGAVMENPAQIDTYFSLRPASEAAAADGGSTSWIYALIAAVAALVAVLVVWLRRRANRPEVEQGD